ncbi:MAG TPA: hypothetical protein VH163_03620 [Gemmatimonadales bacterium]|jgi:hypothetical protein|nr:hypothetical protein [Gemmatimonadales bacterium]
MSRIQSAILMLALIAGVGAAAQAQAKHPVVCAKGVWTYTAWTQVPAPFDSLTMPPGPRIMVNSPEEAAAAEGEMLRRAGQVGATGVVVVEVTNNVNGPMMISRKATPVFVPADSARAYGACRK